MQFTLGSREAEPQRVQQYEAGVRGSWRQLQASLTAFRNTLARASSSIWEGGACCLIFML